MAGTRKSERMSERRRHEEEDEERKREDDRKRQKTLFQRKDNIIRKNDVVVDTRLGKVAFVPEEAPEDVKVKVEAIDEEGMGQMIQSEDNHQQTEDNFGTAISDSREIEGKQETNAAPNMTATNEQVEARLDSLKLEMEGIKQLVKEQDRKIDLLSTELESVKAKEQEKISQLTTELETEKKMRKAGFELLKAKNGELVESVNQLTREMEAFKRKVEEEINLSRGGYASSEPQNQVITGNDREPEGDPAQSQSQNVAVSSSVNIEDSVKNATKTLMIEDPDMEAVLSRILEYIGKDVQGLKTFRSVCRAWNQISLPIWRNTAILKLCKGIEVSRFLNEYRNNQSPYELADKPYSRYKLTNLFFDERKVWNLFWDLIGPSMEYVHFQDCDIANTTTDAFPKLLIEKMPNLKELALTSVKYDKFEDADTPMPPLDRPHLQSKSLVVSGQIEIYLDRLLVCLPSLESITAINDGKKIIYDDTLGKICLAKRLKPASLPNLKHLDFMNTYTKLKANRSPRRFARNLERLIRANLELKTFGMNLFPICKKGGVPNIDPFLRSQATTLQVLKLFHTPTKYYFHTFLWRVEMTALKELYLWGTIPLGLDFLKYTPNLKVLYVNLTCLEKRDRMKQVVNISNEKYKKFDLDMVQTVEHLMEGVVVKSLETLHIDYEFPEKSLRTLAKWAPNLKILKTIVSWNNVSAVVEEWSELKELTCLFESKIRDWNICKEVPRPRRKTGAVISDLKKLEHFQLDCLCDASILTDVSVFNGFLKMSSLKSVQLCVSKQFTDQAEKALKQGVDYCRIIRNYTGGDHSNYGCCERREFDLEVESTGLVDKSKDDIHVTFVTVHDSDECDDDGDSEIDDYDSNEED